MKKLLKTFSNILNTGLVLLIFGSVSYFVLLPIFNTKTSAGKFEKFLRFKNNPAENNEILDETSVYGCLSNFLIVAKKICTYTQLIHRDEEFLHRNIHTYPFYRNLMILIMDIKNFDGDKYGLSKGLLDLYRSSEDEYARNRWQHLRETYKELIDNLSDNAVSKEGCDHEYIEKLQRNV